MSGGLTPRVALHSHVMATEATVGRPFEKGKSGNPGGRPKGLAKSVRDMCDAEAPGGDGAASLARIMVKIAYDETEERKTRMDAIKWLTDRGWGKTPSYMPVEMEDPLELTDRELRDAADQFTAEVIRLAPASGAGSSDPGGSAETQSLT